MAMGKFSGVALVIGTAKGVFLLQSDKQRSRWRCLTTNLPPISSVSAALFD